MLAAVTSSGGPSVIVHGWVAVVVVVAAVAAAFVTVWKILWPMLQLLVDLSEQMPFLRQSTEKHAVHEVRLNEHEVRLSDHEERITRLEHARR